MRIGVISDTHGHADLTLRAIRMLESLEVEQVLHCGDIGSEEVVALFDPWPTHFVWGNCDYNRPPLAAAIERQSTPRSPKTLHGEFGELELAGARVALLHSHDRAKFRQTIDAGDYDLVCYGHTHQAAIDRHSDTVVLNPGAVYRANPHSVAIVELPACDAQIIEL